jgi:hypothetical protein
MQEVTRNSQAFPLKKYRFQNLQPSNSADTKLPDLMPAATISIPLSACVLKLPVWRTANPSCRKLLETDECFLLFSVDLLQDVEIVIL